MPFNPDKDIPSLAGKIILVTGGSSGLGKETILQLAKHEPAQIYLTARTQKRGDAAIAEIEKEVPQIRGRLTYLELDLGSFQSIKQAAQVFREKHERLDILINNAGIFGIPAGLTTDGYEIQLGTNWLGPALFTKLLLPVLEATAAQPDSDVRVINLSSDLFKQAPSQGVLLDKAKTNMSDVSGISRYSQSKLADYFYNKVLAEQHPKIKCVAIHPGVVTTGILDDLKKRRPFLGYLLNIMGTVFSTHVSQGAYAQLWASTAPTDAVRSGGFYNPSLKEYTQAVLKDDALAKKLWDWSEEEFRQHGF